MLLLLWLERNWRKNQVPDRVLDQPVDFHSKFCFHDPHLCKLFLNFDFILIFYLIHFQCWRFICRYSLQNVIETWLEQLQLQPLHKNTPIQNFNVRSKLPINRVHIDINNIVNNKILNNNNAILNSSRGTYDTCRL